MILRQIPSHRTRALLAGVVTASLFAPVAAQADCNSDMGELAAKRTAINAVLDKNKKEHAGKIDPVAACPQLKALAAAQGAMVSYMAKNKDWCGLPDELVKQSSQAQVQISGFAVKACGMVAKIKQMQAQQATMAQQQQAAQAAQVPQLKLPAGPL